MCPSGLRTASAWRFSRTATATSASSGSAPTAPVGGAPDEAGQGHGPCAGVVVAGRQTLLFSVAKGSSYAVDVVAARTRRCTRWRHPVDVSSRCCVFTRRPMGGVPRRCAGLPRRLRPAVSHTGRRIRSTGSGFHPIWSPDGKELFYAFAAGRQFVAVSVTTRPTFTFGNPVPVPRPFVERGPQFERNNDITPDGKRFLGVVAARTTRVRRNLCVADSGRAELVRGAEGACSFDEIADEASRSTDRPGDATDEVLQTVRATLPLSRYLERSPLSKRRTLTPAAWIWTNTSSWRIAGSCISLARTRPPRRHTTRRSNAPQRPASASSWRCGGASTPAGQDSFRRSADYIAHPGLQERARCYYPR